MVAARRRFVSGAEEYRMAVRIRDGEAPAREPGKSSLQAVPAGTVRLQITARQFPRFRRETGCSPRPAQSADALPQRGVRDAQQTGDFGPAQTHVGEQRYRLERRSQRFNERPWEPLFPIPRRIVICRIQRFPAPPPPLGAGNEQRASPEHAARPGIASGKPRGGMRG